MGGTVWSRPENWGIRYNWCLRGMKQMCERMHVTQCHDQKAVGEALKVKSCLAVSQIMLSHEMAPPTQQRLKATSGPSHSCKQQGPDHHWLHTRVRSALNGTIKRQSQPV